MYVRINYILMNFRKIFQMFFSCSFLSCPPPFHIFKLMVLWRIGKGSCDGQEGGMGKLGARKRGLGLGGVGGLRIIQDELYRLSRSFLELVLYFTRMSTFALLLFVNHSRPRPARRGGQHGSYKIL